MKKRFCFLFVCIFTFSALWGCKNVESVKTEYARVNGVGAPDTDLSSEETVDIIFECLKKGDSNSFNQYVCYPIQKKGFTLSGYNIMFGAQLDEEEERALQMIMSGFTYEIEDVSEKNDTALIKVSVLNRDMSSVREQIPDADSLDELQNILENCNKDKAKEQLDIMLVKEKKTHIWNVVIDKSFQRAISGGLY